MAFKFSFLTSFGDSIIWGMQSSFKWLPKLQAYGSSFLQETYSTLAVENNNWRIKWKGGHVFLPWLWAQHSHFIILKATLQNQCLFVNVHTLNETSNQQKADLNKICWEHNNKRVIGGGLHVVPDPNLDGYGGHPTLKESAKKIDISTQKLTFLTVCYNLVNVWWIWNPSKSYFTWNLKIHILSKG